MNLHDWIDLKLDDIYKKLPLLVNEAPESFQCGYNMGYKHAVLDLDRLLDEEVTNDFI